MKKCAWLVTILFITLNNTLATGQAMPFSFKNKKLTEITEELALKKNINIIYPQKADDAENFKKQEVTYQPINKDPISIEDAWNLTAFFLGLSGYSWFEKNDQLWEIIPSGAKDTSGISKEPVPTYISTSPKKLPNNTETIRYVYYLSNLKITNEQNNPIKQIIKDMSSPSAATPVYLPNSNGFILIDQSNAIYSIINLISKLDKTGFREDIQTIPLFNVHAKEVVSILNALKLAAGNDSSSIRSDPENAFLRYFNSETEIVPDTRMNTVTIMGMESNVNKIKNFIHEYMDTPAQSGKSILHAYDLQYLNAKEFEPILQKVVANQTQGSQGSQSNAIGPERFFQGVAVKAEELVISKPTTGDTTTPGSDYQKATNFEPKGFQGQVYIGGNRIIVAAMESDWKRIKKFIKQMDIPQPQVILEVVIADFSTDKLNQIAGSSRSLTRSAQNAGQQFLSSNISSPSLVLGQNPQKLAQDLLSVIGAQGLTSNVTAGSTLISFNDPKTPGVWGLIRLLDSFIVAKIQSSPFIIGTNNQKATISQTLKKRARGDMIPGENGSFQIPIEEVTATIKLDIIPHIASNKKVKLDVGISIEGFVSDSLTRITRGINTTASISNDQILAIGGLVREQANETWSGTPILRKIPLIGLFFRNEQQEIIKNNIVIFISSNIVMPRAKKTKDFTEEKLGESTGDLNGSIGFNDRDPITRLFFKRDHRSDSMIKDFDSSSANITEIPLKKKDAPYDGYLIPKATSKKPNRKTRGLISILKDQNNPLSTFAP